MAVELAIIAKLLLGLLHVVGNECVIAHGISLSCTRWWWQNCEPCGRRYKRGFGASASGDIRDGLRHRGGRTAGPGRKCCGDSRIERPIGDVRHPSRDQ